MNVWFGLFLVFFAGFATNSIAQEYAQPSSLIPDTAAGAVRVPDMPKFCDAWKTTTLYGFLNDPAMKPFVDAQREQAEKELLAADLKVGIKPRDLLEIASGEAVIAWLPFKDPRRPFSVVVIADVRQLVEKATAAIDQVDKDLKQAGATRNDVTYGSDTIRVYSLKAKPGQLKLEQVALCLNNQRLIASDRESVITATIDAAAGKATVAPLVQSDDFMTIRKQSESRGAAGSGVLGLEWFARPLSMARIVKEAVGIDRGRQVDVLNLLERQGFDALRAAGGQVTIGTDDYDLLHHGFVLAPPTTNEPTKYKLAARMMEFPNAPAEQGAVPEWVDGTTASLSRLNWNMEQAFWASETLINDAFGDEIFRDIFDGIRDDEDGPKIDMQKNVVPNLGDHLYLLTDNTVPAAANSERLAVAIEVKDAAAIREAVRKAMEVEPDASLIEGVEGVDIYRVLRTDEPSDFDAQLFQDIGLEETADADAPPPLLNQWAISVVGAKQGKGGYLVFSSHPEMLIETIKSMMAPGTNSLAAEADVKKTVELLDQIGGNEFSMRRIVRSNLSLRVKYSLLRESKLRDSDSLLASIARRTFEEVKEEGPDPIKAKLLPPFEQVEKYFRPAATSVKTASNGWFIDGFLLK